MATIKLFENWLNEQGAGSTAPKKPHEGTSAAQSGEKLANAEEDGIWSEGNPGVFDTEIMTNDVNIPFASKKKPGFIVDVQFPPRMTRDKAEWFFEVDAYEIFPTKSAPDKILSRAWRESYSLRLPDNHPSMKNTSKKSSSESQDFSLEGNPIPTDIPKGSYMSVAASDMFKKIEGVQAMALPVLYVAHGSSWNMTPDQFASLIDLAKPGAKASLLKQIPAINTYYASTAAGKDLLAWAKTQAPATPEQVKPAGG